MIGLILSIAVAIAGGSCDPRPLGWCGEPPPRPDPVKRAWPRLPAPPACLAPWCAR